MLTEVLGGEKAIVRVDATLNFERLQKNREVYDPAVTVVRSEERDESAESKGGGTSESSVTNYEINKTVETIVGEVGNVKTLSVSVFVDGRYAAPTGGGDPVYTPLSEEELNQIQRVVRTAIGIDTSRGDRIEVVNMQFRERGGARAGARPAGPAVARIGAPARGQGAAGDRGDHPGAGGAAQPRTPGVGRRPGAPFRHGRGRRAGPERRAAWTL